MKNIAEILKSISDYIKGICDALKHFTEKKSQPLAKHLIGKHVICRCYYGGVHYYQRT